MSDGKLARQVRQRRRREDVRHVAHRLVTVDLPAIARRDSGAFLTAVLQRVQAQIGEVRRLRMTIDGDDAALFVELVKHCS